MNYLRSILDSSFMPHGHCFFWTPDILWLHVIGDAVTATSYYLIPFALVYFVWKRRHLPYPSLFIMFGIFILACGTTHIMGVVTLWHPLYRLEGVIKVVTAIASIATTIALYPVIPKALRLRTPEELESINVQLAEKNWELAAGRESFRNIVERDPGGIVVLAMDGTIVFANPSSRQYLPGTPADPVGGRVPEAPGGGAAAEFTYGADSEGPLIAESWISETQWQGLPAQLVHLRDITARKRTEAALRLSQEQLQQAQKMDAIGRLAGGIAHDFNNLLTAINGFTSLSLVKLPAENPVREHLIEVARAGERASQLTRQLLAFSRKQLLSPQSVDLNKVVAEMGNMIRRIIGEGFTVATRLDPDLAPIRMDPGQLEQIIINLAVNARDAMPDGGELLIETAGFAFTTGMIGALDSFRPGNYAMLAVSDKGQGMSPEVMARLFEPFFTTKAPGKGTGLGLSMVYGIVKQSEGHIMVTSEPGRGSTFKLYFPLAPEAGALEAKAAETPVAERPGHETVLLVEDEAAVRRLASEVLRSAGYHVLSAHDGEAALDLARRYAEPIHILVTDVIMPKLKGSEVARQLARSRPDIRILYMSGFTEDAAVRNGILNDSVAFLQKPFSTSQLLSFVRKLLDAPAVGQAAQTSREGNAPA
ncbi:MAG: response regulator [Fibrobacteres bacterium]|nr:response regulator [Fibrobacterota bacterium]